MLKFIIMLVISVWATSTLFMLFFWFNAVVTTLRTKGKFFFIPFGKFCYIHFCPIVHTIKCFEIMRRYTELKSAQKERRGV